MSKRVLSTVMLIMVTALLTSMFQPLQALQTWAQPGCQTFKETGKTVCGRFLQYWQQNGSLAQQGFPLTNEFIEASDLDGKTYTVQYFQRAVFELHPENKLPHDVLLSQLGTFQFRHKYSGGQPTSRQPQPPPRTLADSVSADTIITALKAAKIPVASVTMHTAENDGNRLLGRPFQYYSKVNWHDSRLPKPKDLNDIDADDGGSIEIFPNEDGAHRRAHYLSEIWKSFPPNQYLFTRGPILLRVSTSLTATQAQEYKKVIDVISLPTDCRTFSGTGKSVCGDFLQYWEKNGGLAQQGLPISDTFTEVSDLNGQTYTVQYFERAVFERHPENKPPHNVLLSQLGTFQFKRKYGEAGPGQPVPLPTSAQPPPTQPAKGPKLEVVDYRFFGVPMSDNVIAGIARNTGDVPLGSVELVAMLKDANGKIIDTEDCSLCGPEGVLMPNDLLPFRITVPDEVPPFTAVEFQAVAKEAVESEVHSDYRSYQVSDLNRVPRSYAETQVLGTVQNTGGTSSGATIYILAFNSAGRLVDTNKADADIGTIPAGQTTSFKVVLNNVMPSDDIKIIVYGSK